MKLPRPDGRGSFASGLVHCATGYRQGGGSRSNRSCSFAPLPSPRATLVTSTAILPVSTRWSCGGAAAGLGPSLLLGRG